MKFLGNILWFVLAGVWLALGYIVAGVVQLCFIITIPFAIQSFKLAGFALWPFGRAIVKRADSKPGMRTVGNFLWFIFAGLPLAILHLLVGAVLCLTIIGIPFGIVSFRMAALSLTPFGKEIVDAQAAPASAALVVGPAGSRPLAA